MRGPASTLDIHTQFVRAVPMGDTLTVTARVLSMGPVTLVMSAEARNVRGKLVATATANAIAVGKAARK
jgi:acyl-coenzyme A thioesterase PaaI-like protein